MAASVPGRQSGAKQDAIRFEGRLPRRLRPRTGRRAKPLGRDWRKQSARSRGTGFLARGRSTPALIFQMIRTHDPERLVVPAARSLQHRCIDTFRSTIMQRTSPALADAGTLAGRLLLAALFLPAGIGKASQFAGTVAYISSVGLPLPSLAAAVALTLEIVGGIALILGFRTRFFALAFAAFTLTASFFFHAYWAAPADQQFMQQLLFFKNLAVVGGLLFVAAQGAGRWSLDARGEAVGADRAVVARRAVA